MRFRVTLEYDGREFVGWQRQANGLGVQEALETAIFHFAGETSTVYGAGRTDSGVHASGQVAHFDLDQDTAPDTVRDALNFHLKPLPVCILDAMVALPGFHARFDATGRSYAYTILNRRPPPVLDRGRVWWVPRPLDVEAMNEAAQRLEGHHDFTTFRAALCQARTPLRTLDFLRVLRDGERVFIRARARSFLHHQVRNMAGTLVLVGECKWSADDVSTALKARDRGAGGPTAPPYGLCLTGVTYGESTVDDTPQGERPPIEIRR